MYNGLWYYLLFYVVLPPQGDPTQEGNGSIWTSESSKGAKKAPSRSQQYASTLWMYIIMALLHKSRIQVRSMDSKE